MNDLFGQASSSGSSYQHLSNGSAANRFRKIHKIYLNPLCIFKIIKLMFTHRATQIFPHFLLTLPPLRSVILDALNSTSSVLENSFSTQSGNNSENHSGNNGNNGERGEEERMTWLQRWDQPLCSSSLEPHHLPPQWSWSMTIAGSNRNSRSGGRGRRKHNRSQLSL